MTTTDDGEPKVHVHPLTITEYFNKLEEDGTPDTAVALFLTNSGERYFVERVLNEWDNAVEFIPEGRERMLVFKSCIESVRVSKRPHRGML